MCSWQIVKAGRARPPRRLQTPPIGYESQVRTRGHVTIAYVPNDCVVLFAPRGYMCYCPDSLIRLFGKRRAAQCKWMGHVVHPITALPHGITDPQKLSFYEMRSMSRDRIKDSTVVIKSIKINFSSRIVNMGSRYLSKRNHGSFSTF